RNIPLSSRSAPSRIGHNYYAVKQQTQGQDLRGRPLPEAAMSGTATASPRLTPEARLRYGDVHSTHGKDRSFRKPRARSRLDDCDAARRLPGGVADQRPCYGRARSRLARRSAPSLPSSLGLGRAPVPGSTHIGPLLSRSLRYAAIRSLPPRFAQLCRFTDSRGATRAAANPEFGSGNRSLDTLRSRRSSTSLGMRHGDHG